MESGEADGLGIGGDRVGGRCGLGSEGFRKNFGVAAAGGEAFAAFWREQFGVGFAESAFLFEEGDGLGGESEEGVEIFFAREIFDEAHEFASVALIFVGFADVEAGEFSGVVIGVGVEGDASDGGAINFEQPVIFDAGDNFRAGAADEFFVANGLSDEGHDRADILFEDAADLLVLIRVDHGSEAFVAEDFGEEGLVDSAVEEVDARQSLCAGPRGAFEF